MQLNLLLHLYIPTLVLHDLLHPVTEAPPSTQSATDGAMAHHADPTRSDYNLNQNGYGMHRIKRLCHECMSVFGRHIWEKVYAVGTVIRDTGKYGLTMRMNRNVLQYACLLA